MVDKVGWLERFMLGRTFTIGMILIALAIVVPITCDEVMTWGRMARADDPGDKVHSAFEGQGSIGVVLVALGVILEGRHAFVRKVMKTHHIDHLPGQEEFTDVCELFGFYVLVLGLLIECVGELVKFLGMQSRWTLLFTGLSIALNVVAVVFLLRLILKIALIRLSESGGQA